MERAVNLSEAIELMKERNRQLVLKHRGHTPYTQQTDEVIRAMLAAEAEMQQMRNELCVCEHVRSFMRAAGLDFHTRMAIEKFPALLEQVLQRDRFSQYAYATAVDVGDILRMALCIIYKKEQYKSEYKLRRLEEARTTEERAYAALHEQMPDDEAERQAINSLYRTKQYRKWKKNTLPE